MQPYFFPYIGYWQLINAVNEFILFDDVQYIRHGWINRNRVLSSNGGWHYLTIDLKKHSRDEKIKDIQISENLYMKSKIYASLSVYKNKARFYNETMELISNILDKIDTSYISEINFTIVKDVCDYLGIKTRISISSEQNFDYSKVKLPGDWALEISKQMGGNEYINPYSGKELFDSLKFLKNNIKLRFIKSKDIIYDQGGSNFEPWLSIIDVLMFNGREKTINFLKYCDLYGDNYELLERTF